MHQSILQMQPYQNVVRLPSVVKRLWQFNFAKAADPVDIPGIAPDKIIPANPDALTGIDRQ